VPASQLRKEQFNLLQSRLRSKVEEGEEEEGKAIRMQGAFKSVRESCLHLWQIGQMENCRHRRYKEAKLYLRVFSEKRGQL